MFELRRLLDTGKIDEAMALLKSVFASVPFESSRSIELHYRNMVFLLFTLLGARPLVEYPVSSGRIDLLLERAKYIYIFEFKLNQTAKAAIAQIESKHYADAYFKDKRDVIMVGASFSDASKNLQEWEYHFVN
jgi:hypothetical protein